MDDAVDAAIVARLRDEDRKAENNVAKKTKSKKLPIAKIAKALGADPPIPVTAESVHRLSKRVTELEEAIRTHRDAKGHELCWELDTDLYQVLNEPIPGDQKLPEHDEFLNRCEEYYEHRCEIEDARMGVEPLEKQIGDTLYTLTRATLEGAQAMLDNISYPHNPYRDGTQSHDDWNDGHTLADASEGDGLTKKEIKAGFKALEGKKRKAKK